MAAETWLLAQEAVDLGLADRIEQPVRMAAHFDLSRFRNTPPQLAALAAKPSLQEDAMSDSNKTRSSKRDAARTAAAPDHTATTAAADAPIPGPPMPTARSSLWRPHRYLRTLRSPRLRPPPGRRPLM
jgi:hypothetical protein